MTNDVQAPHENCTGSGCREDKTTLQLQDGERAQAEALTVLQRVRRQLDAAIADLSEYGDAPMSDLERRRE